MSRGRFRERLKTALKDLIDKHAQALSEDDLNVIADRGSATARELKGVRPLAAGVAAEIAAGMGWGEAYTKGVLRGWKLRAAYCKGVLREEYRYDLSGAPTSQAIDKEARTLAR